MHEDQEGRFWVGTYNAGLILFDPETGNATRFTREDGLPEIAWLEIPAGAFRMGEGDSETEVDLPAYRMGRYLVTNGQYQAFVDDAAPFDHRHAQDTRPGRNADRPHHRCHLAPGAHLSSRSY